jgi:N-glycosylase/DNA lyase
MTVMDKDAMSPRWSDWQPLPGNWRPSPATLAETLDGGQSFRWQRSMETVGGVPPPREVWTGIWSDCVAQLRLNHDLLAWRAPAPLHSSVTVALPRYLALDTDWAALTDALPWRSDAHLAGCIAAFPGLRLLRQPFGETLLGFLCSATKQIVQIKQMCALLAERHGVPLLAASTLNPQLSTFRSHRLPTWPELAVIPEKDLRLCQLGFRARFIAATAQYIARRPGWLEETEKLPYAAAKARLIELPGVGEKVADCVLLFGAGRLEAFPVDTWVLKSLARRYGLTGWKPAQVAHFGRTHFGPLAGLAQQYLFAWERRHGGR